MAAADKQREAERRWLTDAMEGAGVKPSQLAAKTGLDANWISQWKGGTRPMTDIGMLKIAKVFGISPYEVRPSLKDYAEVFLNASILDGLSDRSRVVALQTIEHLRAMEGVGMQPVGRTVSPSKPGSSSVVPIKKRRKTP